MILESGTSHVFSCQITAPGVIELFVFKWNVNYFVSHARYPPCLSLVISPSSGTRYLCLLQQTLRFSFDRSLADFHSDFLSFPSNFTFTTWTVFPLCFLCFRPSSSRTDPSVLEPIRSRYRCRHSFSLSLSPSTRSVSTSPHLCICDLQRVRTENRIWLLR